MIRTGFTGQYEHSLDDKGRVSLPSKYKKYIEQITANPENAGQLVLTTGKHECIEIFTGEDWERMVESFNRTASLKDGNNPDDIRDKSRMTDPVSLDKSGRITINANLKKYAGIKKKVVFVGVIDRIEIWDPQKLEEYYKGR
ncbi:MAG TPA: division/cell wall cluster transcriptional repressor MraZ [Candidatus Goldiibacteriota bacterium]|nr:division/cell wall cluster transcriptional repressor MraZ [Candidatus Goldiibacteriota bacterium]